jgi:c-di-GMP-binding flagellar brake protein YcgR
MVDSGKLQGEKLVALFKEVVEKKIILSMHLVGSQYDRLTYILGMDDQGDKPHLIIDNPEGIRQAVTKTEPLKLRFNFNGPDKLEYIFETKGGEIKGRDLHIPLPDYVERIQRRKNFRVDTPVGSEMHFTYNKEKFVIALINISLGGIYGVLVKPRIKEARKQLLKKDQSIYRLNLHFPADKKMEEQNIMIRKTQVRRVEIDKGKKIQKYAFEFVAIDPKEKEALTRSIYHIQRQILQRS